MKKLLIIVIGLGLCGCVCHPNSYSDCLTVCDRELIGDRAIVECAERCLESGFERCDKIENYKKQNKK